MCNICCDFVSSLLKMITFAGSKNNDIHEQVKTLVEYSVGDTNIQEPPEKPVKAVKRTRKKTEK